MVYLKCSKNLILSARPSLEVTAFCEWSATGLHGARSLKHTEHVLCIAATVSFCGIAKRNGGGILLRNLARTFGRPRGAKAGLDEDEDTSCSRLGMPWASSPPSPVAGVSGLIDLLNVPPNLLDSWREVSPQKRQPPWNARRYRSRTKSPPPIPGQAIAGES